MTQPPRTSGYKVTTNDTAFIIEHTLNRDAVWLQPLYDAADDKVDTGLSGLATTLRIYDRPGGTLLLSKTPTMSVNGMTITLDDADNWSALIWDAGERVKHLVCTLQLTDGAGVVHDIFDDTGERVFPFYLFWSPDQ